MFLLLFILQKNFQDIIIIIINNFYKNVLKIILLNNNYKLKKKNFEPIDFNNINIQ